MGCVIYELLTLTKVFDATNPLKLAQDIVCSEFGEIDPRYADKELMYSYLFYPNVNNIFFPKCVSSINFIMFSFVLYRYSDVMKQMVYSLLNKDSSERPTAAVVLQSPLFHHRSEELEKRVWSLSSGTRKVRESSSTANPVVTNKSSEVYFWGGGKLAPQNIAFFQKARGAIQVNIYVFSLPWYQVFTK